MSKENFQEQAKKQWQANPNLRSFLGDSLGWNDVQIRKELINCNATVWDEHAELVEWMARLLKPKTYMEVGANHGSTFNRVAALGIQKAVAVEIKKSTAQDLTRAPNTEILNMSSDDAAKLWLDRGGEPIDLLFIDGDHSHEQSLRDFLNFSRFVPESGLILLHDTWPETPERAAPNKCHDVYKTAWLIRQKMFKEFELVTLPFDRGISVVRRAQKPLVWSDERPAPGPFSLSTGLMVSSILLKSAFHSTSKIASRGAGKIARKLQTRPS